MHKWVIPIKQQKRAEENRNSRCSLYANIATPILHVIEINLTKEIECNIVSGEIVSKHRVYISNLFNTGYPLF